MSQTKQNAELHLSQYAPLFYQGCSSFSRALCKSPKVSQQLEPIPPTPGSLLTDEENGVEGRGIRSQRKNFVDMSDLCPLDPPGMLICGCLAFWGNQFLRSGRQDRAPLLTIAAVLWTGGAPTPVPIHPGPAFPTVSPLIFPETLRT